MAGSETRTSRGEQKASSQKYLIDGSLDLAVVTEPRGNAHIGNAKKIEG